MCKLPDVTCQTTGRCVRRPASGLKRNLCWGSLITILKEHAPFFLRLASFDPPNFLALSKKKKRKKIRQSWTFLTLINSFDFKDEHYENISRHKRFGGVSFLLWIKSTIILSAIFSLFRFGDQVLFSLLGIGGRKKQRDARERHAYLLARTFFIAPYFDVDILNSASRILQGWSYYVKVNSSRHEHDTERTQNRAGLWLMFLLRSACYTGICLLVFKLHHREPTLSFVNCTWKLNER